MASTHAAEIISTNPATGQEIARIATTTPEQLDAAVTRAWHAFHHSGWKSLLPHKRALVLQAIADGLAAEKESLARLQMQDNGKPLGECRGMVESAIGTFRYYAGVCETLETDVTPARGDYVSFTVLEPFGADSKARADMAFVRKLFALGRTAGQEWLHAHRKDVGVRPTINIAENT